MKSKQFLWLNIILSSNIIFGLGVVCYFLISVFCYINDDKPCICYVTNNVKTIYVLLISYILIKIILFPCLLLKKYKHTFSYKFLKKFVLNKIFARRVLCNAILLDFLFNFVISGFFIFLFNNIGEAPQNPLSEVIITSMFFYIIMGSGSLLSYLSLILLNKIKSK